MKTRKPVGWLQRSSPMIMTCISVVGMIGTAVLSAKAAPKAKQLLDAAKKEKGTLSTLDTVKVAGPVYIPAIVAGTLSAICMFSVNSLSKRTQASITSAYALLDQSYKRYQGKVKEIFGEDAHKQIIGEIVKEDAEQKTLYAPGLLECSTLDFDVEGEPVRRFYDSFFGRAFDSTIERVIQAEYHFNRCFAIGGGMECINRFYDFLGLSPIEGGDCIGWDVCEQEIYWIDFQHSKVTLDDGFEYLVIDFVFDPIPLKDE